MDALICNVLVALCIAGVIAACAKRDNGYVFIGAMWTMTCLSVSGWVIYAIVHFVTKYW